jgi:pimeloyl-ACP methyl ester carboxylesterase
MQTQFLNHDGGTLAYDDRGAGSLVICVPSMGDLRAEYRLLAPQLLDAGYRVVTLDLRGHGESSVKWNDFSVAAVGSDILALIRHLNAGPAIVMGDSMAAGAVVWVAAEAPDAVAALVLLGPVVRGRPAAWQRNLLFPLLFARPWGPAAWKSFYATLYPSQKPADFAEYSTALAANLAQPGRIEALRQMIVADKSASEQRVSQVKARSLIIMGSKDPDFTDPAAEAAWLAEQLGATSHLLEGIGHYPHAETPDTTGQLVLNFLQTVLVTQEPTYAR